MPTIIQAKNVPASPFSTILPNLQIAWDSTSLKLLMECPRKYYYVMIENWSLPGLSIHLDFGIKWHEVYEHFQYALFSGAEYEEAVLAGVREALSWDDSPHLAHKDFNYKNRHTLARTFVWYAEHYRDDNFKVVGITDPETGKRVPAVELSFRMDLGIEAPGGNFFLCGHLDALGEYQDDYWFMDHKTTKSALNDQYFAGYSPNVQMTNYFAAAQVVLDRPARGGIVNAAQLLVNASRFARRPINRTPGQMHEWERDLRFHLSLAQRYAEEQHWPMNTNSCDNFGGCAFRPICARDPKVRQAFLTTEYEKRVWNPLDTRGEL